MLSPPTNPELLDLPRMSLPDRRPYAPPFSLLAVLAALLLFFWRFGYDYAISDQDELIPYLLHQLQPLLFENDWFVQTQVHAFSVREYTISLLRGLCEFFPVWLGVGLVYVISWGAIALASYRITYETTRTHPSSTLVVLLVLVFTPQWTLGGNDLVARMLTPSMLGWALALPALYTCLGGRWLVSGILLGLAAWFQPLVGLLTTVALSGAILLQQPMAFTWSRFKPVVSLGGSFAVAALPAVIPLAIQQFGPSPAPPEEIPSLYYIMAEFRNPHHYLPSAFPIASYIKFGGLTLAGTAGLAYLSRHRRLHHRSFIVRLLLSIGVLMLVGFIGTEVVPMLFIAELQLFKLTVLAKLLLAVGLCGGLIHLASPVFRRLPSTRPTTRWIFLGAFTAASMGTLYGIQSNEAIANRLMRPWAHQKSPLGQLEAWTRQNTPPQAVFAVPPSNSSFRSQARRSVVVTFKAFPFQPEPIVEWWQRLTTLAPVRSRDLGGADALAHLDRTYHTHSGEQWKKIAQRYAIDFILIDERLQQSPLPFEVLTTRDHWILYRLPD